MKMKATVEVRKDDILVRCRETGKDGRYEGPSVKISHNKDWVFLGTDDYDGTAMFNVEALSAVRRALAVAEKQVKANHSTPKAAE